MRFLLNNLQRTVYLWPNYTILFHTNTYTRSAETGEIFGLSDYLQLRSLRLLISL